MSDEEDETVKKKANALPLWGNAQTMNINNLIVTNILSSPYFKNELIKLKTFHEVIDEIYYKVDHLEPWERGSRKTHGQVGMCGGVRGVGAGGIVSSGYCLLFKMFTLKLTKKQVNVLINHPDSPYIRGIGFMFIRYCQHPNTFWEWYEPYLEDDEEIDPKAGTGCPMTIGQMVRSFILKLDWYGTLFPRIPVPIHKELEANLKSINLCDDRKVYANEGEEQEKERESKRKENEDVSFGEAEKYAQRKREERSSHDGHRSSDRERETDRHRSKDKDRHKSSDRDRHRGSDRERHRSSDQDRHRNSDRGRYHRKDPDRHHKSREGEKHRDRDRHKDKGHRSRDRHDRKRSRSRDRYK